MIRRSIISVVSVCAALAVGIALGGGPLSHADDATSTAPAPAKPDGALTKQAAFGQTWATQIAPDLYGGKLAGRRITIVTLPGADAATVQQLRDGIAVAKGTISGTVALANTLLDPNQKVAVDTLGTQYARQSHGAVSPSLTTYMRIGEMLGVTITPGSGTAATSAATTAREALSAAKFATFTGFTGSGTAPASLVLVVAGEHGDALLVNGVLWGLASKVPGMVVAGDTTSGAPGGLLADMRKTKWSNRVMTVDGVDTAYGRVAAVAGLVAQLASKGGSYGASGIDGLVPLG